MAIDKNQRILEFIMKCDVIADNPLYFNFVKENPNTNQLLVARDNSVVNKPFVDGTVLKQYAVDILLYKSVAYNPIVVEHTPSGTEPSSVYIDENMVDMRDGQALIDWILEKNDEGIYPDFGSDCIVESIEPTTNKPTLTGVNSDTNPPLAQYVVGIKVTYFDISKQLWK